MTPPKPELPEWVNEWGCDMGDGDHDKLIEALTIAWKALIIDGSGNTHAPNKSGCPTCVALAKIRALGGEREAQK